MSECPPCENGGQCQGVENRFVCVCPNGYYGDLCQSNGGLAVNVDVLIALVVIAALVLIFLIILLVVFYIRHKKRAASPQPPPQAVTETRQDVYNVTLSRAAPEPEPAPQQSYTPDGQVYNVSQNISIAQPGTVRSMGAVSGTRTPADEVIVPQQVQLLYPSEGQRSYAGTVTGVPAAFSTTPNPRMYRTLNGIRPTEDVIVPERAQLLYPNQQQQRQQHVVVESMRGYKQPNVQRASPQTQTLYISQNGGVATNNRSGAVPRMVAHVQPEEQQTVYVMNQRPAQTPNQLLYVSATPNGNVNPNDEVIVPKEAVLYHPASGSEPQTLYIPSENHEAAPQLLLPSSQPVQVIEMADMSHSVPEPATPKLMEIIEPPPPPPPPPEVAPQPQTFSQQPAEISPEPTRTQAPEKHVVITEPEPIIAAAKAKHPPTKNGIKKQVIFQTQNSVESTTSEDFVQKRETQFRDSEIPFEAQQMLGRHSTVLPNSFIVMDQNGGDRESPGTVNQAPEAPPTPPPPPPIPETNEGVVDSQDEEQRWKAVIKFQ